MLPAILGSMALVGSIFTIWWTLGGRARSSVSVVKNMTAGLPLYSDLRDVSLARSASDRTVGPLMDRLARTGRRLTPAGLLGQLERRILLAGTPQAWPLERVLAAKAGFAVLGLGLGLLAMVAARSLLNASLLIVAMVFGFLLPDLLLYNRAQKRTAAIRRALPDKLDQLTISVEAGLGFDSALLRIARTDHGPLAEELQRTMQDVQAGMSRREALGRLSDRVNLAELRSFVQAVIQAEQYGLSVGTVLRVQASELRSKRKLRAEEKAMRLPVTLLFPTVIFIFPTLFIVLLGPVAIQISRALFGN